jgi:hypothetical protein
MFYIFSGLFNKLLKTSGVFVRNRSYEIELIRGNPLATVPELLAALWEI